MNTETLIPTCWGLVRLLLALSEGLTWRHRMKAHQVDKDIDLWHCLHSEHERHRREGWLKWLLYSVDKKYYFVLSLPGWDVLGKMINSVQTPGYRIKFVLFSPLMLGVISWGRAGDGWGVGKQSGLRCPVGYGLTWREESLFNSSWCISRWHPGRCLPVDKGQHNDHAAFCLVGILMYLLQPANCIQLMVLLSVGSLFSASQSFWAQSQYSSLMDYQGFNPLHYQSANSWPASFRPVDHGSARYLR